MKQLCDKAKVRQKTDSSKQESMNEMWRKPIEKHKLVKHVMLRKQSISFQSEYDTLTMYMPKLGILSALHIVIQHFGYISSYIIKTVTNTIYYGMPC